ncbi:MAG TPA: sigma-70 family RNA polymerase sigma factor [Chitinophagaceae bacterium]
MSSQVTYSEPELIALLKQGEETAYSFLYDHYGAALFGIILRIIGRQELAEDALQEVFLKIYRNIDHYEVSKGRLFTWMLNIARNTAIDIVRSKDFRISRKIRELDNDVNANTIKASVMPFTDHLGLDKVLSTLNQDHRKVIDMAYFRGYTQEEIAKELGIPLGTVKTRIRNALMQLRDILK